MAIFTATFVSILNTGYKLDDLLIYLPMTVYLRDPSLYPGSPLIQQLLSMPYPAYRAYALAYDHHILFALFAVTRLALVAGLWQLGQHLLGDRLAAALGVGSILLTPSWFGTLGGTSILQAEPSQFALATPFCVFALGMALAGRLGWAFVLGGFAFNLQPILGAVVLILLATDLLLNCVWRRREVSLKRACVMIGVGALLALPAAILTLAGIGSKLVEDPTDYVQIVRFTAYYQIFPSTFTWQEWVSSASLVIVSALMLRHRLGCHRATVVVWLLVIGLLCFAGTLFSEVWPISLALKLMPFRATLFLKVLGLFLAAVSVRRLLLRNDPPRSGILFAVALIAVAAIASARPILIPGQSPASDLELAGAWAKGNTSPDALFATPPDASSAGFTLFSERSTLGDYKLDTQAVWDPGFAHIAYERLAALGCLGPWNPWCIANSYASMDAEALTALSVRYGACYALVREGQNIDLPLAFSGKSYRIYALCNG